MAIATINPATGETLRTFPALTDTEIETKLQRAHDAFQKHKRTSMPARAECMMRAASILEARSEDYGRLMTVEMGKPLKSAIEEVNSAPSLAASTPNMPRASCRRRNSDERDAKFYTLPAARRSARRDAMELSFGRRYALPRPR
jgi:acyl-CoA reductase-like NAD-dependent aldehyde dehydrogenase